MPNTQPSISRKEHDSNRAAKRVVSVDAFGGLVTDGNYTTYVDVVDSSTTYIGVAQIGTSTATAGWQIKKILVVGSVTSITWAESTDTFNNVWDNRASLSYS